jgi:transcription initiation factor IIE alpha subunit
VSQTIRCPKCAPRLGFARLAFDNYFVCEGCGSHLSESDLRRMLEELKEEMRERDTLIGAVEKQMEINHGRGHS